MCLKHNFFFLWPKTITMYQVTNVCLISFFCVKTTSLCSFSISMQYPVLFLLHELFNKFEEILELTIFAASSKSSQARIRRSLAAIKVLASSTRVPNQMWKQWTSHYNPNTRIYITFIKQKIKSGTNTRLPKMKFYTLHLNFKTGQVTQIAGSYC